MPTWPIEMPSDTEIVPNSSGYPPAACTPSLTAVASRSSERLHGVISFQLLATPICGLAKSSSSMPTARSMPREAVASRPSVTSRLRGLRSRWAGGLRHAPESRQHPRAAAREAVLARGDHDVRGRLPLGQAVDHAVQQGERARAEGR